MRNLAVLLTLAGGVALTAQQAVFRTTTQYVAVDAVVTDRQDRLVANLTREDFEFRENGVVQRIADFDFVSVPLAGLAPGRHVITVGAATSAKRSAKRQVVIDVR